MEVLHDHICKNLTYNFFGTLFWSSAKGAKGGGVKLVSLEFKVCIDLFIIALLYTSHLKYYMTMNTNVFILLVFCALFLQVREKGQEGGAPNLPSKSFMFLKTFKI